MFELLFKPELLISIVKVWGIANLVGNWLFYLAGFIVYIGFLVSFLLFCRSKCRYKNGVSLRLVEVVLECHCFVISFLSLACGVLVTDLSVNWPVDAYSLYCLLRYLQRI